MSQSKREWGEERAEVGVVPGLGAASLKSSGGGDGEARLVWSVVGLGWGLGLESVVLWVD